jgi:DNA-binding transcriptional regulator YiaG
MERRRRKRQWNKEDVRALRQHLNLTQAQLAEELGTRQQTISEWENGMYCPRGTSATLLSIVAERSGFIYSALNKAKSLAEEDQDE